jgi:hypothetical protein
MFSPLFPKPLFTAILAISSSLTLTVVVQAGAIRPGFDTEELSPSDEESVEIQLSDFNLSNLNFLGTTYSSLYVNNDGNVTFSSALTVFPLSGSLSDVTIPIISPFFADVDTRNPDSAVVTYGSGSVNGRPAFGVNWPGVGYFAFAADKLNQFQLIIVDRSDVNAGNFDIEFNYDQVVWETGDFQGGNNGLGGTSAAVGFTGYTLPGSGVPRTFLDNGTNPLTEELSPSDIANGSGVPGRYIFSFGNSPTPITTPESGSLLMLGVFGLSCLTVLKR